MPPLVGVAVKLTFVPVQTVLDEVAIDTKGVSDVPTVIVTLLEVAVVVVAQAAFEVSTQLTTSPFAKAALV